MNAGYNQALRDRNYQGDFCAGFLWASMNQYQRGINCLGDIQIVSFARGYVSYMQKHKSLLELHDTDGVERYLVDVYRFPASRR